MQLVIVESPAKAKTIEKYLGKDFRVMASYGHVRDLPSKDGSVRPDEDFAMIYEADPKSAKHLAAIVKEAKNADRLILATDPDREGEAISWHVLEALRQKKAINGTEVKRVVFNEITKTAILDAMKHPRDLDMNLINAQQARRALDYLVGFTLSPVLWRKLPGARSAGRVQSVALRLICERELEIEAFKAQEYWTIEAEFATPGGERFSARLTHLDGKKLDKFDLATREQAEDAARRIAGGHFAVTEVATKPARRNPYPPFTTSTLQQEAARKLGFAAKRTMDIAQRLYEGIDIGGETVGLITYMRTDGVAMAGEAIAVCRDVIGKEYGASFLPDSPRVYKAKAKNAQEAHEAIRPTDPRRSPAQVGRRLSDEQRKLYELIWKRAIASQMESARLERTAVDLTDGSGAIVLRASGTVVQFPGFLKLYEEGHDDNSGDEDGGRLPVITQGMPLDRTAVTPSQHFTEPPPRYSEASLVKRLEELGIGRPSTYASILSVLRERDYVHMDRNRFIPEDKGRIVTAFLTSFFARYVEYDFTARLEEELDEISAGQLNWKQVLREFWKPFNGAVEDIADLRVSEVLDRLNDILAPHIFPDAGDGKDPRACPACGSGRLSLKLGRYGGFIGCSDYPECRFTRTLGAGNGEQAGQLDNGPKELGSDPQSGLAVTLRKGPYGFYVQLGEAEGKEKPKRVSLPREVQPNNVTFELALKLLSLPRQVGPHPETGKPVTAGLGRYGPYVEHERVYARVASFEEVLDIGLNRAVTLIAEAATRKRKGAEILREVGKHPVDGEPVNLMEGRYGPYVSHGKLHASLPKDAKAEEYSLDEAVALLAAKGKASKGKGGKNAKAGGAKKTAKSAAAKTGKKSGAQSAKPKTAKPKSAKAKSAKSKSAKSKSAGKGKTTTKAAATTVEPAGAPAPTDDD